jgi:penicillin-binding protein A
MNARIRRLAAALLLCYVVLFVQLNFLQVGQAREFRTDARNTREVTRDFNKPRGPIVTADGVVAAESVVSTDGKFDFQRTYPTGDLFANVTGYYSYAYGATQLEKTQNDVLSGSTVQQQLGGITGIFNGDNDNTGSVVLTMRSDLQQLAKDLLGGREGSIVAVDPRSGAILAMYSTPVFDPNEIAVHDTKRAGDVITFYDASAGKPLLANAYQERYMPGSTFKMVTTATAFEAGVLSFDSFFPDENQYLPPLTTDPIENYGGSTCGGDMREVFARSCNTPFARTAVELGAERMVAGANAFGLNEALPIDLPRPAASFFGQVSDFDGATPLLAIRGFGQNEVALTPLHMTMVAASIANGGQMMSPYVVAETRDHDDRVLSRTSPSVWKTPMSPQTSAALTELMVGVVQNGTARSTMQLENGIQAAAKTGTAQLNGKGEPPRSHAWITAFAPAEAPRIAVAVMLKGTNAEISAGTGGTLAGPLAKQFIDYALTVLPA